MEIRSVELIGNTIDLDIIEKLKTIKGALSKKDIEAISVKITDEYHFKGYTTSYVARLIARNDGVLEIHIKESKILGVSITGLKGDKKKHIKLNFISLKGQIYNRRVAQKLSEIIKAKYDLASVKIFPVNYKDSSDVFLSIELKELSVGKFYGGIGFEPVYGVSPAFGYYYPFTDTAIDIYSRIGYRDGEFRRAEGKIRYFIFANSNSHAIYVGSDVSRFVEFWESKDIEYKRISATPLAGFRSINKYYIIDAYIREIISNIKNYENTDENNEILRDYDTRLTLDISLSNKAKLLSPKDSTDINLSISGGKNNVNDNFYGISSMSIKSSVLPFAWLRFIPALYFYYTTSEERYFWQYVYDKKMLGFFNDYTSSKSKNIAGLDMEFEISPQFVYAGPFINYGYFFNESDNWEQKTGLGVKCAIVVKKAYVEVFFSWDLAKDPSDGGLAVLAGGRF